MHAMAPQRSCHATPCHASPCHASPCHAMPHHKTRCVMLHKAGRSPPLLKVSPCPTCHAGVQVLPLLWLSGGPGGRCGILATPGGPAQLLCARCVCGRSSTSACGAPCAVLCCSHAPPPNQLLPHQILFPTLMVFSAYHDQLPAWKRHGLVAVNVVMALISVAAVIGSFRGMITGWESFSLA